MICLNVTLCNRGSANSFISFSILIQCDRFMSALLQSRGRQPLALKEPFGPVATITKPTQSLKVMDQCAQTMLHLNCIWLKTSERRDSSVSGGPQTVSYGSGRLHFSLRMFVFFFISPSFMSARSAGLILSIAYASTDADAQTHTGWTVSLPQLQPCPKISSLSQNHGSHSGGRKEPHAAPEPRVADLCSRGTKATLTIQPLLAQLRGCSQSRIVRNVLHLMVDSCCSLASQ